MASPVICFIDDSPFERRLMAEIIAPSAPGFEFLITDSYAQVQEMLGGRVCLLFLLDLYGPNPEDPAPPTILGAGEIDPPPVPFKTVWEGLDSVPEDARVNEYLRRLYSYTNHWGTEFTKASRLAGQGPAYGLYNLGRVIEDHPWSTAVVYTRKALASEVGEFLAAGGDGAMVKPPGADVPAIEAATKARAGEMMDQLGRLVIGRATDMLLRLSLSRPEDQADYLRDLARAALLGGDWPTDRPPLDEPVTAYLDELFAWMEAL